MKNYLQLLREIKERGVETGDRTGTGTLTLPGYRYACPLYMDNDGVIHNFPLLTTKKVSFEGIRIFAICLNARITSGQNGRFRNG